MTESTALDSVCIRSFSVRMPPLIASRRLFSRTASAAFIRVYCRVVTVPASNPSSSDPCTTARSRRALMFSCTVTASFRFSALMLP